MEENVTLDTLAEMVAKGFNHVDERFDEVGKRFDENNKQHQQIFVRLDKLEQGQEDIKSRLDQVAYSEIKDLNRRLTTTEERLDNIRINITGKPLKGTI